MICPALDYYTNKALPNLYIDKHLYLYTGNTNVHNDGQPHLNVAILHGPNNFFTKENLIREQSKKC